MNQLVVQDVENEVCPLENEREFALIEQVVMQGDLSKLNPQQRVMYYKKVCGSCGLNPFTRPFDYIFLNGKLTLYAKKDATEQLRKLNGISIEKLEDKVVDDLYIVKATARDRFGRTDESTGAVSFQNLKGDAKANAIMKAETKAKRRVTLSISGMGWVDETEIESIPDAKKADIDLSTGEFKVKKETLNISHPKNRISKEQAAELNAILAECSLEYLNWFNSHLVKKYNTENLCDLPGDLFERMKAAAVKNMEENFARNRQELIEEESEVMTEQIQ